MKLKILALACLERLAKLCRGDYMKYRLQRYRLYGAHIGDNVRAFSPISSAESYLITVGANTTIAGGVKFVTHDNAISKCSDGTDLVGKITIGSNCFIGQNTVLLPGISIADDCIIGAGSVVTNSCDKRGQVIAGNPARRICKVEDYKRRNEDKIFDFRNQNRRQIIENNPEKLLSKEAK